MRRIKLMADYECWPLWEASPGVVGNVDPNSLGLSASTLDALGRWAKHYDSFLNIDSPLDSREVSPEEQDSFTSEGRRLWALLQVELSGTCEVLYFESGQILQPSQA